MPTLCFTGMDRAEEAKLKLMFSDANEWLGGDWTLVNEAQAKVIVVDLDSIYGHMTWLKVHNTGKYVIAITTRSESEAEHVLLRPVTVESLVAALNQAVAGHVAKGSGTTGTHQAVGASAPPAEPQARPPSPPAAPAPRPSAPAAAPAAPPAPAAPAPAEPARRMAPAHAREPVLGDYLQPGGLPGPSRLELAGSPPLVIDPRADTYIGGPTLKPYVPYCEMGAVRAEKWQSLSGADLNLHMAGTNTTQPLARLRWLYALVRGKGTLAPGYDMVNRFRLTKWPKTEREFPKHLRIATTMMQSPGTPNEIAAKSDTPVGDVVDFINACLDSGHAEAMGLPPPPSEPAPKTGGGGGLFGRLRGGR